MKRVLITSDKYPSFQFAGLPFVFAANQAKDCEDAIALSVQSQWATFAPAVKRNASLHITDLTPPPVAPAIAPLATPPLAPPLDPSEEPTEPDLNAQVGTLELSGEDRDLIEVELSKLTGKTIAECKPLVKNLAYNPDLHIDLRLAYLNSLIEDQDDVFQKGLQEYATELMDDLTAPNNG